MENNCIIISDFRAPLIIATINIARKSDFLNKVHLLYRRDLIRQMNMAIFSWLLQICIFKD